MKTEFLRTTETEKEEFFTHAAKWMDSIKNGTLLPDGRNLQEELTLEEKQELENYVMEQLYPEMEEALVRYKFLNYDQKNDLRAILALKMYEEFYKFNNSAYIKEEKKQYVIGTFVGRKACEAMREFLIKDRDLPVNAIRNLRVVINAIVSISADMQISPDAVTPEMVAEKLADKSISYKMIVLLMNIYHGDASIEEMEEEGNSLLDSKMDVEASISIDLDKKTKNILDEVFHDFSKLEFYIMMKEFGFLGEKIRKMTAKELSYQDYFVDMAREDRDGKNNIDFGEVCIKRPGRNLGREDEYLLVEGVSFVKEKFYSNKVAKIKKKLSGLRAKVSVSDLQGCLGKYCMALWKEKYL